MRALQSASTCKVSTQGDKMSDVWLSWRCVRSFGPPSIVIDRTNPKAAECMSSGADTDAPTLLSMDDMMDIWTHPELVSMRTEARQVYDPLLYAIQFH